MQILPHGFVPGPQPPPTPIVRLFVTDFTQPPFTAFFASFPMSFFAPFVVTQPSTVTTPAFDLTLTTNTGVTLVGNMVLNKGSKVWRCRIDSSTTVTIRTEADTDAIATAQVQTHITTTSTQALTANTIHQITGLSATITPSSTGKRIKITVRWNGEFSSIPHSGVFGLQRGSTDIGSAAAAGTRNFGMAIVAVGFSEGVNDDSTPESCFYSYIDSPATTSAVTYSATIRHITTQTLYNQRTVADNDGVGFERLTSTIILEEIN